MNDRIVVLDFGGQHNQLIVHRIREIGVYAGLYDCRAPISSWMGSDVKGIVLTGGPRRLADSQGLDMDSELLSLGVPVLGICYGLQWMTRQKGGKVEKLARGEYGQVPLKVNTRTPLFHGLPQQSPIWMDREDGVKELPRGFKRIAWTDNYPIAAIADEEENLYGVQFRPEVSQSKYGMKILKNFVLKICACQRSWLMEKVTEHLISKVALALGNQKVLCALSGGVDSSVAGVIVSKAVGDSLTCLFIDNGLLRQGEAQSVMDDYEDIGLEVVYVDAKKRFLTALAEVTDSDEKYEIIVEIFHKVLEEEADRLGGFDVYVEGTTYSDQIRQKMLAGTKGQGKTGHGHSVHEGFVIEPLKALFKDEVRQVGRALGLDSDWVQRQPFPSTGLALRIEGEVTQDRLDLLRQADEIACQEIELSGYDEDLWQYGASLIPTDAHHYIISIHAITSEDGLHFETADLPIELLKRISDRILDELKYLDRVVYEIGIKS